MLSKKLHVLQPSALKGDRRHAPNVTSAMSTKDGTNPNRARAAEEAAGNHHLATSTVERQLAVLEVLLHSSITLIDVMIYTDFQKYDATHTGLKFAPNARKPYTYMHLFVPFFYFSLVVCLTTFRCAASVHCGFLLVWSTSLAKTSSSCCEGAVS